MATKVAAAIFLMQLNAEQFLAQLLGGFFWAAKSGNGEITDTQKEKGAKSSCHAIAFSRASLFCVNCAWS